MTIIYRKVKVNIMLKDVFYGLMIIVIIIGGMVFAADKYAKYETRQKVMEHFEDNGTRNDIEYSIEKIGPLVYKCTGTEEGLFGEQYSYIAGFDTEGLFNN